MFTSPIKCRISKFYVTYKRTEGIMHVQRLFCLWNLLIFLSISLPSPSPSSLLLFNEKCSVDFLNISTSPPLPSPKHLTVFTSIMQTPLYCGQLCLWSVPLTLVKPLPAKNSIVRAPRYIRESSIGSRESLPLQYGHLCINWFQRCQFTQSLPLNKDNAVTRTPASVPVVSSVTNYDHIVSPPNRTSLMLPDCLAFE